MEVMSQPEQQQQTFEWNFTVYVLQKKSDKWTQTCFDYAKCV